MFSSTNYYYLNHGSTKLVQLNYWYLNLYESRAAVERERDMEREWETQPHQHHRRGHTWPMHVMLSQLLYPFTRGRCVDCSGFKSPGQRKWHACALLEVAALLVAVVERSVVADRLGSLSRRSALGRGCRRRQLSLHSEFRTVLKI